MKFLKTFESIKGRQRAVLNIDETSKDEKQEYLNAWLEFSRVIRESDDIGRGTAKNPF
jgi:hypothetical protein